MANLEHGKTTLSTAASWEGSVTQEAQAKTYHFGTAGKYVDQDIDLKVVAQGGTAGAITGGSLTHGDTTLSNGSTYIATGNTGYGPINFTNTASRAAASYSITTEGWIKDAGSGLEATGDDSKTSSNYYVKAGAGSENSASATITGGSGNESTPTAMSILTTAPTSGNYYTLTANGSGSSKITTAGWMPTGALAPASTTKNYYVVKSTTSATSVTPGAQQTVTIGAGYYPSSRIITVKAASEGQAASINASATDPGTGYTSKTVTLASGGYLKINAGYIGNTKISLADLVPDNATIPYSTSSPFILTGYTAYDNDGKLITGGINNSTTSGSNNSATASASASATSPLAATMYRTSAATGYTKVAAASASSSVGSVSATKTASAGYLANDLSVTASVAGASNSANANIYLKDSTVAGSDKSATASASASANAYASTSNLATGTYESRATTGYTYHIDSSASSSASVGTQTATKTIAAGYLSEDKTVTASVTGSSDSKEASSTTYLLDSTAKVGATTVASGSTLGFGDTLTIGKGYYPSDRTFTAPLASSASAATLSASGAASSVIATAASMGTINTTSWTVPINATVTVSGSASAATTASGYATKDSTKAGPTSFTTTSLQVSNLTMPVYSGTFTIS